MTATFPSIKPSTSSSKTKTPRVKSIQFGNGYKQIYGDGINNNLEVWSIGFTVNDTNKQSIETFLNSSAGYIPFYWTAPENGSIQKMYLCTTWNVVPLGRNIYSITANFEEWAGLY